MKVVLDTNVIISGIFFGGSPGRLLSAWSAGEFELILSPEILSEYANVPDILSKRHREIDISRILRLLVTNGTMISPAPLPEPVCADPDDDKFLACALAAKADVIVSGDKQLLRTSGYQDIQVITPRAFVEFYLP
ncbi:MAG: putative toxin-antitoxin system toxin component, PIN family [Candidatus Marinimicrobia bacterium]|nr:putative toxin-antitoxin system toxin component, PIN family [Candidatus Neomarinimicrobiota bacterium]